MAAIILNAAIYAEHDIYLGISGTNMDSTPEYSELKLVEKELKSEIKLMKEELADKEAYLISLDEELIRLEDQYYKLLEESKRIAERLNSLKAANTN